MCLPRVTCRIRMLQLHSAGLIVLQSAIAALPVVGSAGKTLLSTSPLAAAAEGIDLALRQHSEAGHQDSPAWGSPPMSRSSQERAGANKSPLKLVRQVRMMILMIWFDDDDNTCLFFSLPRVRHIFSLSCAAGFGSCSGACPSLDDQHYEGQETAVGESEI